MRARERPWSSSTASPSADEDGKRESNSSRAELPPTTMRRATPITSALLPPVAFLVLFCVGSRLRLPRLTAYDASELGDGRTSFFATVWGMAASYFRMPLPCAIVLAVSGCYYLRRGRGEKFSTKYGSWRHDHTTTAAAAAASSTTLGLASSLRSTGWLAGLAHASRVAALLALCAVAYGAYPMRLFIPGAILDLPVPTMGAVVAVRTWCGVWFDSDYVACTQLRKATRRYTTPHHTTPHHTAPHHITPHHTAPHRTTPH